MTLAIPLAQIEVREDRQRKVFNDKKMDELMTDISIHGLLHPIVVVEQSAPSPYPYRLVAGGRRFKAITNLHEQKILLFHDGNLQPSDTIPATRLGMDKTELDMREAELSENMTREDLTWQDKTAALAELHAIRTAQNPKQSMTATAQEFLTIDRPVNSNDVNRTSRANIIADFLDDPEVARAPDETTAFRIVSQKLSQMFAEAKETDGIEIAPTHKHELYHGDMTEVLSQLETGKYACCVTDPPYGIGVDTFGGAAALKHNYSEVDYVELHENLVSELTRICSPDAHVYCFCALEFVFQLRDMFEWNDWRVRRRPLIWYKGSQGHLTEGSVYGFRASYECILVASRGDRQFTKLMSDVIRDFPSPQSKVHAAEKPVSLYKELLSMSCDAGEYVIDPFAGSGPIFDAATELHLHATGVEMDAGSVAIIEGTREVYRAKG